MKTVRKITPAQIEKAIGVLAEVSEHADIDGAESDEIGRVIHLLELIAESGGLRIEAGRG